MKTTTRTFKIGSTPCKAFLPGDGFIESAVLAVHGFSGSKDGSTIDMLARSLCPEGIAVYGFDFPAHGDNPLGGESLSVAACSDALLSTARYVRSEHPRTCKGVFATSFGGYMTLLCLDELDDILDSPALVLKAPAVKMAETFERVIVGDRMDLLKRQGYVELGFGRKMNVRRELLDDLKGHDACRAYGRSMLVLHGDSDEVVAPADIDEFVGLNPLAKLVRIPGAGHEFSGEGQTEAVVEAAGAWFEASFDSVAPYQASMQDRP